MKITTKDIIIALFITLSIVLGVMNFQAHQENSKYIKTLQDGMIDLTRQVDTINTSYITIEMLQPALDDLARYEDKVDCIEDIAVEVLKQNEEWSTRWNKYFEPYGRLSEK
jgi:hypothetical protein